VQGLCIFVAECYGAWCIYMFKSTMGVFPCFTNAGRNEGGCQADAMAHCGLDLVVLVSGLELS
jgi:hypothetical protein